MELQYLYSFNVPNLPGVNNAYRQLSLNNSAGPIAFVPERRTILLRGHPLFNDFAELTIPSIDGRVSQLIRWIDPSAGLAAQLVQQTPGTQGYFIRSLVISDQSEVFGCVPEYYNVGQNNRAPFFRGDLSLGGFHGPWNGGRHSLLFGEYLAPLSPELREFFGCRWCGGATFVQGSSGSNHGPSMYVFDMPEKSFPSNGSFFSSSAIAFQGPNSYPGWNNGWDVNSICCTDSSVLWIGRKALGAYWYGTGNGFTDAKQPVSSLLYSGQQAFDASDPSAGVKGYHSEKQIPVIWECSNSSIKSGSPQFTEHYLSQWCVPNKGSDMTFTYDRAGNRLFVVDPKSDFDRPVIRVFSISP